MTINMKTTTKKVASNCKRCKHKRCKTQTSKIKITMTKKFISSYNQKGGERRWRSTWGPWPRRLWIATKDATTRDVRLRSLRSRSQWRGRSLVAVAKREEKEVHDQHEDHNHEGHGL
jgi:hypothetical protein